MGGWVVGRGSWTFQGRLVTRKKSQWRMYCVSASVKLEAEERDNQRRTQALADAEAEILKHAALLCARRRPNCTSSTKR